MSRTDIDIAQDHLTIIITKLAAAMAVLHEGREDDGEMLGELLKDCNLEAWRARWDLGGDSHRKTTGSEASQ